MPRTFEVTRLLARACMIASLFGDAAQAQSGLGRQHVNERFDYLRFIRHDVRPNRIVGTSADGRTLIVPLASNVTIFGLPGGIRPGDDIFITSTTDASGAVARSDVDVNLHTLDGLVTSISSRGFAFVRLDYYTGVPLPGTKYVGRAIFLSKAAIDIDRKGAMQPGTVADIHAGDKVKIYGFERPNSRSVAIFRIEDRGRN